MEPISRVLELARSLLENGSADEARTVLRDAAAHHRQAATGEALRLFLMLAKVERASSAWDELSESERSSLETALSLAQSIHGAGSPQAAQVHELLGAALHASGDAAESVPHMEEVVSAAERWHGRGVLLANALIGLGQALLDSAQAERALAAFERAIENARDGELLPLLSAHFGAGRAYLSMGLGGEALTHLERAHEIFVGQFGGTGRRAKELLEFVEQARVATASSDPQAG